MWVHKLDDYQSWRVGLGGHVLAIDPWLTPEYRVPPGVLRRRHEQPPSFTPESLPRPDALVITAPFADHFDRATVDAIARDVPCFAPPAVASALRRMGFTQVHAVRAGQTLEVPGGTLHAIAPGFPYSGNSIGVVLREAGTGSTLLLETHTLPPTPREGVPERLDLLLIPVESVRLLGLALAMSPKVAAERAARLRPAAVGPTGVRPDLNRGLLTGLLWVSGSLAEFQTHLHALAPAVRVWDAAPGAVWRAEGAASDGDAASVPSAG
jgi:L-ascorbate metabolism protein UlaG (beta-lactamase superfamily)